MITQSDLAGAAAVAHEVDLTTSGRGTSPIVRSFARAATPSSRNMAGGCPPLNPAKRWTRASRSIGGAH